MTRTLKRIISLALLAVFCSSSLVQSVSAMDEVFYSSNDILYYDPAACQVAGGSSASGGAVVISGNDVAEKIFRFLTTTSFTSFGNKPFNALQAAGVLGNFQQESTMNPGAVEPSPGTGIGLAQWSSANGNHRKATLLALASSQGKPWQDLTVQVTMIRNEISNAYGGSLVKAGFESVSTPQQASFIFQKVYEGAGIPAQSKRDAAAAAYYEKFKNLAPSTDSTAASGTTADSTASQSCTPVASTSNFASDGFVIYNQYDPKWANLPFGTSTIAAAGCGPSAMAMVITALTGKSVTPADTTAYANTKNLHTSAGSSWTIAAVLAQYWGLKANNISASVVAINQVLTAGGLIVTSGSGASPFTSGGHYIVIRGLTADGKWKIGDSNGTIGGQNSNTSWDPKQILDIANAGNIVAVTK